MVTLAPIRVVGSVAVLNNFWSSTEILFQSGTVLVES
jgi:hypothetical protein